MAKSKASPPFFHLTAIAVKNLQPTGAFSSVFAPVLVQTPQQKAYIRGGATPREHFALFLLPYPLKNMITGAFSSLFAPVPVQTPQQKAYNGGGATPREHLCLFLLPYPLKNMTTGAFLPHFAPVLVQTP